MGQLQSGFCPECPCKTSLTNRHHSRKKDISVLVMLLGPLHTSSRPLHSLLSETNPSSKPSAVKTTFLLSQPMATSLRTAMASRASSEGEDARVIFFHSPCSDIAHRKIIERRLKNGLEPEKMGLRKIVYLATGAYHSFAKDDKGKIYAWGLNANSQTAVTEGPRAGEEIVESPTLVTEFNDKEKYGTSKVIQIDAGEFHSIFLLDNGDCYTVGRNDAGQLGLGESHEAMQLPGTINAYVTVPQKVTFPDSETTPGQKTKIVKVNAGTRHCMAVSATGEVYAWGANSSVHLGLGADAEFETVYSPVRVKSKQMTDYKVSVACAAFTARHVLT